jgi:hypothetical protein
MHRRLTSSFHVSDVSVAGGSAGYAWTCSRDRGALLLLPNHGKISKLSPNNPWTKYMKQHHTQWYKWAKTNRGWDLKPEDLILIRGTVLTTEWTVAAFQSTSSGHSVSFQGSFVSAGNVGFELSHETQTEGHVEYRRGPDPASRSPSPSPSTPHSGQDALSLVPSGSSSLHLQHSRGESLSSVSSNKQYNQCVFLPYYKIKYRIFPFHLLPRKIEAGAGYDDLGGPHEDDDSGPAPMVVVTEGEGDEGSEHGADGVSVLAITSVILLTRLLGPWSCRRRTGLYLGCES